MLDMSENKWTLTDLLELEKCFINNETNRLPQSNSVQVLELCVFLVLLARMIGTLAFTLPLAFRNPVVDTGQAGEVLVSEALRSLLRARVGLLDLRLRHDWHRVASDDRTFGVVALVIEYLPGVV